MATGQQSRTGAPANALGGGVGGAVNFNPGNISIPYGLNITPGAGGDTTVMPVRTPKGKRKQSLITSLLLPTKGLRRSGAVRRSRAVQELPSGKRRSSAGSLLTGGSQ